MKIEEILREKGVASKDQTRTSFALPTDLLERFHKVFPNANLSATLRQTLTTLIEEREKISVSVKKA